MNTDQLPQSGANTKRRHIQETSRAALIIEENNQKERDNDSAGIEVGVTNIEESSRGGVLPDEEINGNSTEEEEEEEEEEEDDEDSEEEDSEDEGNEETDGFVNGKKSLNEDEEFQLSSKYRELNKNLEEQRSKLTTEEGVTIVKDILNEAEELFKGAKTSSSTVIIAADSATLKEIGEQAKIATQNVKFGQSEKIIKFEQFADSWIKCFGTVSTQRQFADPSQIPEYNWANAGLLFNTVSKNVIGCDFMLGPLEIEKKKRIIRARLVDDSKRNATKTANLKKADDVINKDTKDDTSKAAEKLYIKLKNYGKRISLFETVLHPTSFGKTIECMFVCSFLINNGHLIMNKYENGIPFLEVRNSENIKSQQRYKDNDDSKSHIIFSLDKETWRQLVQEYHITTPFFTNTDG